MSTQPFRMFLDRQRQRRREMMGVDRAAFAHLRARRVTERRRWA